MKQYHCTYCSALLNVNGFLVLSVKRSHDRSGLVLLSDEIGDYNVHINPDISFEEGEKAHFHCPCCSKSLEYENNENLVKIFKTDENGEQHTVIFSAIFGERLTYKLSEERQLSYGEHATKYADPEWFVKK